MTDGIVSSSVQRELAEDRRSIRALTGQVVGILEVAAIGPTTREYLQPAAGLTQLEQFSKTYPETLASVEWLTRTIPGSPCADCKSNGSAGLATHG